MKNKTTKDKKGKIKINMRRMCRRPDVNMEILPVAPCKIRTATKKLKK
jgi:hypothetical protein